MVSIGVESDLEPQRPIFGQLSIMDQLVDKGVISDSFSVCYGVMDIGGATMVFGGIPLPHDFVYARSDPVRSPYYNIDLKGILVLGKKLDSSPSVFDGKHGTVLDRGTTFAFLRKEAFIAFRHGIMDKIILKEIPGSDLNYRDICFSGAGSDVYLLSKFFPEIDSHQIRITCSSILRFMVLIAWESFKMGRILQLFREEYIVTRNTFVIDDRRQPD